MIFKKILAYIYFILKITLFRHHDYEVFHNTVDFSQIQIGTSNHFSHAFPDNGRDLNPPESLYEINIIFIPKSDLLTKRKFQINIWKQRSSKKP